MTTKTYTILRSNRPIIPTFDNIGYGQMTPASIPSSQAAQQHINILQADLSKADRSDLRRDPETIAAAPTMPFRLIEPTESKASVDRVTSSNTWGVEAVNAHNSSFDGTGVVVAILDTGIDPNHPAFSGTKLVQKNFTTGPDNDQDGHGTHCAGTVFGKDVNGLRIGIARKIEKALIGKVLGEGGGNSTSIVSAIHWAIDNGAHIVSMSLGIDFPGFVNSLMNVDGLDQKPATSIALEGYRANVNLFSRLMDFIAARDLMGSGTIVVAAAGNASARNLVTPYEIAVEPPAAGERILSVGALGEGSNGFVVAPFSNTQCDVAGPGVDIISANLGEGLYKDSGTSMATPHVAGVAALWAQKHMQQFGRTSNQNLTSDLIANATMNSLHSSAELDDVGRGIIQAP